MEKSFLTWTAAALGTAILLTACNTNTGTTAPGSKVKLDPSKPVSLSGIIIMGHNRLPLTSWFLNLTLQREKTRVFM